MLQQINKPTPQEWARFFRMVRVKGGESCWEWTGTKGPQGYGSFSIKRRLHRAHRVLFSWVYGDPGREMQVCHHCDNTPCVHPAHMFAGTASDNMQDAMRKGRMIDSLAGKNASKRFCVNGHEYTPDNTGRQAKGRRFCRICRRATEKRWRNTEQRKHYARDWWRKNKSKNPEWRSVNA